MDSYGEIVNEMNNIEYEVLMPGAGDDDLFLTPIKVKTQGLQTLVDKCGVGLKCRELGQSNWQTASYYGFKVTYQRKNSAIARRRLQENGLNKPNFDTNSMFG